MREGETLPHPLGIGADAFFRRFDNADAGEQFAVALAADMFEVGEEIQRFKARHVWIKGDGFRQVADKLPRGEAGRAVAVDADAAACRREQAEQHFHQGRFTGAVMSGEGDHFAGVDVDVHLVYGGEVAEGFAELAGSEECAHAGSF